MKILSVKRKQINSKISGEKQLPNNRSWLQPGVPRIKNEHKGP